VKPVWARSTQDFWAPHVLYDSQLQKFVLFYSGESDDTATGKCLGVAFADAPLGPFVDMGAPLICGDGFVNIDPMAFVDTITGKKLLYWGSGFAPIKVQEMTSDWKSFIPGSTPKSVVFPGTERNYTRLIEGAWIDLHDGKYYLYYSGDNCCGDKANYAVMIARSENPLGPFIQLGVETKSGNSVILKKGEKWLAPGHNSIFRDDNGNSWMAYHAINKKEREKKLDKGKRVMCISAVVYRNGWPVVVSRE
jgi:arabinan endo-1,5-alpha-L-arabinosidase